MKKQSFSKSIIMISPESLSEKETKSSGFISKCSTVKTGKCHSAHWRHWQSVWRSGSTAGAGDRDGAAVRPPGRHGDEGGAAGGAGHQPGGGQEGGWEEAVQETGDGGARHQHKESSPPLSGLRCRAQCRVPGPRHGLLHRPLIWGKRDFKIWTVKWNYPLVAELLFDWLTPINWIGVGNWLNRNYGKFQHFFLLQLKMTKLVLVSSISTPAQRQNTNWVRRSSKKETFRKS